MEKRSPRSDIFIVSQYLNDGYKEDRGSFLTRRHMEKPKNNRYKFYGERFILYIRKKFFTERTMNHYNNLLRNRMESSALEVFKMKLDRVLESHSGSLAQKSWIWAGCFIAL